MGTNLSMSDHISELYLKQRALFDYGMQLIPLEKAYDTDIVFDEELRGLISQ